MNRRDLIIVAVVINAAVLTLLFVTAIRSDDADASDVTVAATSEPFSKEMPLTSMSETPAPSLFVAQTPAPQAGMPVNPNFLEEIRSISSLETQGAMAPMAAAETAAPALHPPVAVQESGHTGDFIEVKVKRGDVLERLARHHGSSVGEIMKMNNLPSSRLKIGQVLKIPTKQKTASPSIAATSPSPPPSASAEYYVVKPGDNAWTIAVRNHLKVDDLLKLNNLTEEKARRLKPGDKLRVR